MKRSPDQIAADIRSQLRSILRMQADLRTPLSRFVAHPEKMYGEPRFYVTFDHRPHRTITGLKAKIQRLAFPDERIEDEVWSFAKAVWHLKDWLHRWVQATGSTEDVEAHARPSHDLMICADLANLKKHGENRNRSSLDPRLDEIVSFDTSKNGLVEFFYDGAKKDKEVMVAEPVPIPFRVGVTIHNQTAHLLDDAVAIISRAFQHWIPLIERLHILPVGDDREVNSLREALGIR